MSADTLVTLLQGQPVGVLTRSRTGSLHFRYDEAWRESRTAFPVSLSLPLAQTEHRQQPVEAFLWGLLPDNELVIDRWARRFQVSGRNVFGLLSHVGEDCAGAVQFVVPERLSELMDVRPSVQWLSEGDVAERLRGLREDQGAWRSDRDNGQFSLAGAQPKTALLYQDGRWGVPSGRTPTTHILKPPTGDFDGHAENEHFCLSLARAIGLRAARSEVRQFEGEVAIVVTRYDRLDVNALSPDARARLPKHLDGIVRIHQEDMCQALGLLPTMKYQNEGGPSPEQIGQVFRERSSRVDADVHAFFDALVFNWVIGGTDAHAKNYSVLHGPASSLRLAPLYDVASALPYKQIDQRRLQLAMKIGDSYKIREIGVAEIGQLSAQLGLHVEEGIERASALCTQTKERVSAVQAQARTEGLVHPIVDRVAQAVEERAMRCREALKAPRRKAAPKSVPTNPQPSEPSAPSNVLVFESMYVRGRKLVAVLRAADGTTQELADYRPSNSDVKTGDSVRLGPAGSLEVVSRGIDRSRGR
jgi:serine/threonine-protein kinase HipA